MNSLLRHKQLVFVLLVYTAFFSLGLNSVQLSHGEYVGVMSNLLEAGSGEQLDYNFFIALAVFNAFGAVGISPQLLAILVGYIIVFLSFSKERSLILFCFLFFVFCPSLFMNLGKASKELFITLFMFLSCFFLIRNKNCLAGLAVICYGGLFRFYYLPLGFLISVGSIKRSKRMFFYLFSITVCLIFFGFFEEKIFSILKETMIRRDFGYMNDDGLRRTVFKNLMPLNDWSSFFINYFYAFARMNFCIFFDFGVKDLFLQLYSLFIMVFILLAFYLRNIIAFPLLVNFLIYPLFEPDLGSYLRHLASIYPLYFYLIESVFIIKKG